MRGGFVVVARWRARLVARPRRATVGVNTSVPGQNWMARQGLGRKLENVTVPRQAV